MMQNKQHILKFLNCNGFCVVDVVVRLVSKAMGGAVEMEKLHEFPWVLHLSELKFQLQSNVIPIGLINKGIYCHRALLFKVTLVYLFFSVCQAFTSSFCSFLSSPCMLPAFFNVIF